MTTPFDSLAAQPTEPKLFLFHMVPQKQDPSILDVEIVVPMRIVSKVANELRLDGWKGRHVQITEAGRAVTFNATWVILSSLLPLLRLHVRREVGLPEPKTMPDAKGELDEVQKV